MPRRRGRCAAPDRVVPWIVSIAPTLRTTLTRVATAGGLRTAWFVGNDAECVVIDPAGDVGKLLGHCDSRQLRAIVWTTIWPESVRVAITLADYTGATTYLDANDLDIWRRAEPERRPRCSVPPGLVLEFGGIRLESIHTPGTTPGALCWHVPSLSAVFTGETLGSQGPGGAASTSSDRCTQMASIRAGLFTLPSETTVHPGQGPDTRIGTQRWDRRFWS